MHDCTIGETLKTGAILCSKQDKFFFIIITSMNLYPHNCKRALRSLCRVQILVLHYHSHWLAYICSPLTRLQYVGYSVIHAHHSILIVVNESRVESSKSHTIACIVSPVINLCFRAFFYSFLMKGNFIHVLVDNFLCTYSRAVSILRTTTTCYSTIHSVVRCSRLLKRNVVCRGHLFKWISNRSINTK